MPALGIPCEQKSMFEHRFDMRICFFAMGRFQRRGAEHGAATMRRTPLLERGAFATRSSKTILLYIIRYSISYGKKKLAAAIVRCYNRPYFAQPTRMVGKEEKI